MQAETLEQLLIVDPTNFISDPLDLASKFTNKGFTGHQQLDGVGIIHMGGRIYDAELGRFLQADPFIQDRTNLQGLNRYSYVENNPLSYTDPSGYFIGKLVKKFSKAVKKAFKQFRKGIQRVFQAIGRAFAEVPGLSIVITAGVCIANPLACPTMMKIMAGVNAGITLANGGTIGDVAVGLAVAYVSFGMPGAEAGSWGGIAGMMTDAGVNTYAAVLLTSGVATKAQGGKFIDGVKGAAAGMAIGAAVKWAMTPTSQSPINTGTPNIEASGPNAADSAAGSIGDIAEPDFSNLPTKMSPPDTVAPVPQGPTTGTNSQVDYSATSPTSAPESTLLDSVQVGREFTKADVALGVAADNVRALNSAIAVGAGNVVQAVGNVVSTVGARTGNPFMAAGGGGLEKAGEMLINKGQEQRYDH